MGRLPPALQLGRQEPDEGLAGLVGPQAVQQGEQVRVEGPQPMAGRLHGTGILDQTVQQADEHLGHLQVQAAEGPDDVCGIAFNEKAAWRRGRGLKAVKVELECRRVWKLKDFWNPGCPARRPTECPTYKSNSFGLDECGVREWTGSPALADTTPQ